MSASLLAKLGLWRLGAMALALAFVILVPSQVPPDEFGRYNLLLTYVQVCSAIFLAWPNPAMVRLAREEFAATGAIRDTVGTRLAIHGAMISIAGVAALLSAGRVGESLGMTAPTVLLLAMTTLICLSLYELAAAAGQSLSTFTAFAWPSLAPRAGLLAAIALMQAGASRSSSTLILALAAGYLAAAAASFAALPRTAVLPLGFNRDRLRKVVRIGWAMPVVSTSAFLIAAMDVWILKALVGIREAGVYGWAYYVNLLAIAMLAPVSAVLAPIAADRVGAGKQRPIADFVAAVNSTIALAGTALPFVLSLARTLLEGIPLGTYSEAVAPALLLGIGVLFQLGMACLEPVVFVEAAMVPIAALVALAMVAINLALDLILIPRFGISGPAVATLATYAVGMFAYGRIVAGAAGLRWRVPWFAVVCAFASWLTCSFTTAEARFAGIAFGAGASWLLLVAGRRLGLFDGLGLVPLPGRLAGVLAWLRGPSGWQQDGKG